MELPGAEREGAGWAGPKQSLDRRSRGGSDGRDKGRGQAVGGAGGVAAGVGASESPEPAGVWGWARGGQTWAGSGTPPGLCPAGSLWTLSRSPHVTGDSMTSPFGGFGVRSGLWR